jgi:GNAT superfamily N-acetyltransferase
MAESAPSPYTFHRVDQVPTETIVELYQAGGWWQERPEWRAVIPEMIRGSFCFMVARDAAGRVVGMGRAISDGVSDAYIQDVVVKKDHRGKGIGAELVSRLAQYCAERGIGWIGLIAEPGTAPFYERIGFQQLAGYQPMLYRQS